jgi:rsbT co-antagonist protein RsbR
MIREALLGNANSNTQDLGATVWDNWFSPIKDPDHNIIGALSISTDVTDRERAHAAVREQLHQLELQSHALREMAAPIIQIWKGVLVVPVVGQLSSERVGLITAALLDSIVQTRAHAAILDLTAVAQVDTSTADHLVRILRAVSLLGARGLISGIAPAVAQTIVSMGVDLSQITTLASLHEALRLFIK